MPDFLVSHEALLVAGVAGLAIGIAVGAYVIGKVRAAGAQAPPSASDMLTNFSEMHADGALSAEEYQSIKGKLSERLKRELKDSGQPG